MLKSVLGSLPISGRASVYGHGNGSILLDDLECLGNESNLFECERKSGSHDCTHVEDAAVVCMGTQITVFLSYQIGTQIYLCFQHLAVVVV